MSAISQSSVQRQLTLVTDATPGTGRTVALRLARNGVNDRGRQDPDRHEAL
jgi:NAD(P)-dependent dehydrogenase (short-subunit alcohol dehydrogenase family)